jgi:hypothetical protein
MKALLGIGTLLLASATSLQADSVADATVRATVVIEEKLLPIDVRNSFNTPGFKFFEENKLVGLFVGAPKKDIPFTTAIHTVPDGFNNKTLSDESSKLKRPLTGTEKTVVIYVENGFCPPCDHIVEDVKRQLAGAGWGTAKVFVVNIALT